VAKPTQLSVIAYCVLSCAQVVDDDWSLSSISTLQSGLRQRRAWTVSETEQRSTNRAALGASVLLLLHS